MRRLDTLKKLEASLENFLGQVATAERDKLNTFFYLDSLDHIAKDSLQGRYVNNRLGNWLAKGKNLLDTNEFGFDDMNAIGNLLDDIKKGLDKSDATTDRLLTEIEEWQSKGVTPKRKLIIKSARSSEKETLTDGFVKLLHEEFNRLEQGEFRGQHLLSILDDVLKTAEAKENQAFMHLAASLIYFLKMKGYKITPFVRRLKEIEKDKLGWGR